MEMIVKEQNNTHRLMIVKEQKDKRGKESHALT
jgi:hypothetical protein